MLIGLAGRRLSGKDTIGAYLVEHHGFTRFAFADPLKDLARRLGWNGEKDDAGRALLQNLGIGCREVFGAACWVDVVDRSPTFQGAERVVITDVRLPNEAVWLQGHGGLLIRVSRPAVDRRSTVDQHVSETSVDALDADLEIVNDGALDDLYAKAETVVANLRASQQRP